VNLRTVPLATSSTLYQKDHKQKKKKAK